MSARQPTRNEGVYRRSDCRITKMDEGSVHTANTTAIMTKALRDFLTNNSQDLFAVDCVTDSSVYLVVRNGVSDKFYNKG